MRAQFDKILFIPATGAIIDIIDFVVEVNVYQSLSDHYMQCDLVIRDSVDLGSSIPADETNMIAGGFTGGEMLILQYGSDANPTMSHAFMLYERSSRTKSSTTQESYILSGISIEAFESFPRKISRAYGMPNGQTVASMISNVANEYIVTRKVNSVYNEIRQTTNTNISKELFVEETTGLHRFVIPNMTVDDTIGFLCNEADSQDHIPQYMFYETTRGFHFSNLGSLVLRNPVMQYTYTDFNVTLSDKDQRKIIGYRIDRETNFLENARSGLFASRTIRLDVLKKQKRETVFQYSTAKDKFKKLQPLAHAGAVADPNVNVTLITTRSGHDCQCTIFGQERHLPKRVDAFLGARRSYTNHIFNTKMTVTVPGTTLLNVGDCVVLEFPRKQLVEGAADLDVATSGKYIITKLRNKIQNPQTESEFVTSFECVKDTQVLGD